MSVKTQMVHISRQAIKKEAFVTFIEKVKAFYCWSGRHGNILEKVWNSKSKLYSPNKLLWHFGFEK